MNRLKKYLVGLLAFSMVLSGCSKADTKKYDHHLTVFLWESRLVKNLAPYIRSQYPDMDIEFISGNNNTDLYEYYQEHGQLPDIISVRPYKRKLEHDQAVQMILNGECGKFSDELLHCFKKVSSQNNWIKRSEREAV